MRLLAEALGTLRLSPGGKVAWMSLTREMYGTAGADDSESEGIVNYARAIRGVEVGVLFREYGDSKIKVGLRSRNHVDVSKLAGLFGGGGHPRAAGCLMKGELEEVRNRVLAKVFEAVGESVR